MLRLIENVWNPLGNYPVPSEDDVSVRSVSPLPMDLRHIGIFSGFHVAAETAVACFLFLAALLLALVCCFLMFCCKRRKSNSVKAPGSPYLKRDPCKKGLFGLMLARLEEFDQLTPLVTPGSSVSLPPPVRDDSSSDSPALNWRRELDSSPPPPRRPQQGRTVLVPLLPTRYRPAMPLLGTPDSRMTSVEATSKSCATIPEDDEDGSCEPLDDLLSIDRTSTSVHDQRPRQYFYSTSAYNLTLPQLPPEFQLSSHTLTHSVRLIPVPQYSAPEVPRPLTLATRRGSIQRSPSNGSGHSSIGTGSPVDTTGSVSDSFYINSDVISSANGSGIGDLIAYSESDAQSKYILHRIEEESETHEENARPLREDMMPRSISQQFELMRQHL